MKNREGQRDKTKVNNADKLFTMKKKMWIVIGIAALYFIYLPLSLIWSAIDTGNGMERSVTLLKTVKKDLDLFQ